MKRILPILCYAFLTVGFLGSCQKEESAGVYAIPEGFVDLGVCDSQGKPLYWAKCNLGATKPEECGDYFAWGETTPYYAGTGGWPPTVTWRPGKEAGYDWQSYCGQPDFVEWDSRPYAEGRGTILSAFDAATSANAAWRTPTSEDFDAIITNCYWVWCDGVSTCYNRTTVKGYIVYRRLSKDTVSRTSANYKITSCPGRYKPESCDHIFFPATGHGCGDHQDKSGNIGGYYWSGTLNSHDSSSSFYMGIISDGGGSCYMRSAGRFYGFSVRPVSINKH